MEDAAGPALPDEAVAASGTASTTAPDGGLATLDLRLHPDDAGRLVRLPEIARLRLGRARSAPVRIVWHDTPQGALTQAHLALSERRQGREVGWWLERLCGTPRQPWVPGLPAPVVAMAATPEALGHALPTPLAPIAALEGVARTWTLAHALGPVTLTLLAGTLRAVAAEQPVCRVTLQGPPACLEALVGPLARSLRLTVPDAALAAEAFRTAARPVPPLAVGAPELPTGVAVGSAFAALVAHLTGVLLHWAPQAGGGTAPEPVHQMRVALRRLRSAMSLFRRATASPADAAVKQDLRQLQRMLGPARDWDVFTAGTGRAVAAALPDDRAVARLLAAAERRRTESYAALRAFLDSPAFRLLGLRLACLAAFRPWEQAARGDAADLAADPGATERQAAMLGLSLEDYAAHALSRRLGHVTGVGDDLSGLPAAELHALRIQCKRLRYAAEFFAPFYPPRETRRFLRRVGILQDRLGHLNDGAVAAGLMAELGGAGGERGYAVGVVRGFVAAGQQGARRKVERAWRKFRRLEPFWG